MADDGDPTFSKLSDDVVLKIFFQLEDDPRHWARLSCVCRKFSSLISTICCQSKCLSAFPSISADLLSSCSPPPSSWSSLYKLAVCCPGLLHSGVLLDNSDFGLHRDIGSDSDYLDPDRPNPQPPQSRPQPQQEDDDSFGGWSLYDDLYFDTVYNNSESQSQPGPTPMDVVGPSVAVSAPLAEDVNSGEDDDDDDDVDEEEKRREKKRRTVVGPGRRAERAHLAAGTWSLNREEGNKLLASRFRGDCLYISEWPGCIHIKEKRNYRLFRGFFKNFKRSRVWRTINDGNKSRN